MPHLAWVQLHGHGWVPDAGDAEAWLGACYHVTPRLERVSATCVLLDLGTCTDDEAKAVAEQLFQRLAALDGGQMRTRVRIGIGTSALCAHVALQAPAAEQVGRQLRVARDEAPIRVLAPTEAAAVIRTLPVRRLPALHPAGTVPQEAVERLERYGLRTLGHVARLGEAELRRQFGERVGTALAALAAGRDLRPLVPTPRSETLRCRLAFPSGASAERVLAVMVPVAVQIARRLATQERQACRLRLALTWQRGGMSAGQVRLRVPIAEARVLGQHARDLCRRLLLAASAEHVESADGVSPDCLDFGDFGDFGDLAAPRTAIERVLVEVGDLTPLAPAQATFWRTAAQKHATLTGLAEALARRFGGQPQFMRVACAVPHAILPFERYRFLPLGSGDDREWEEAGEGEKEHRPASWPPSDQLVVPVSASNGTGTPWEGMPHRLHWW